MCILAEYKNESVYIIATHQNGYADIVKSSFNMAKKDYIGKIMTVPTKDLTIIDSNLLFEVGL